MNSPARFSLAEPFAGFTAAEYLHMAGAGAFADMRVELVRGSLRKMMLAYLAHGEANMLIGAQLLPLFAGRARVAVDLMIGIAADTVRAADLAVVGADAPRDRPVDPADILLAVEIAGASLTEDLGAKLSDYAGAGIAAYWVVDLDGRVVHVMEAPENRAYRARRSVPFGEPVAVPGTDAAIVID